MLYIATALGALALTLPLNREFDAWKRTHGKSYASVEEEGKAMIAWEANDVFIKTSNAKNLTYTLGHNEFSDLTWAEFKAKHFSPLFLNKAPKNMQRVHITHGGYKVADAKDWVTDGAVTPVKNQGQCGSCWAFSTTGSVEGAYQIATGKLTSLSEQDLVSCDKVDAGCNGGLMDNGFKYIEKNGVAAEADYPYTAKTGTCDTAKQANPVVTITGYTDVPSKDETALKSAVASQPVSVAIEADQQGFQMYKSGVFTGTCGQQLDHGVLAVGYGTDTGTDYWKVKNSWGTTWGEAGYIRMERGVNMCGISNQASYPTGAKAAGSGPSPTPPSPPAPPSSSHYGDPKDGCLSDEVEITIQGIDGDFCTPACATLTRECPADVPAGVTATPQCALQDAASGKKYCALMCSPTLPIADQRAADAQCGENGSCKTASLGIGLCTYDD